MRDHGPGIPEGELEAVFDKFVQSSKTKSAAGGTGLGLAICREIAEAHGGRMWAENAPGGGALFTCELRANCRGARRRVYAYPGICLSSTMLPSGSRT